MAVHLGDVLDRARPGRVGGRSVKSPQRGHHGVDVLRRACRCLQEDGERVVAGTPVAVVAVLVDGLHRKVRQVPRHAPDPKPTGRVCVCGGGVCERENTEREYHQYIISIPVHSRRCQVLLLRVALPRSTTYLPFAVEFAPVDSPSATSTTKGLPKMCSPPTLKKNRRTEEQKRRREEEKKRRREEEKNPVSLYVRQQYEPCEQVQTSANKCKQVQTSANKCKQVQPSANKCKQVQTSATKCNQCNQCNQCKQVQTSANKCNQCNQCNQSGTLTELPNGSTPRTLGRRNIGTGRLGS
jgi:hypothetical protein